MTIQITRRASLGLDPGAIRTLATATEAALVADREAIYTATPNPAGDDLAVRLDPTSGQIVSADGGPIAAQVALSALVSGAGIRGRKVRGMLGYEPFDLIAATGMPAGASFSGAGSYASAGLVAVQSTGTVLHNATGWYDGTACLDFTPNTDSNAELRIYLGATGYNISDEDGIGFQFGIPENLDTSLANFSIFCDFSSDAVNLFPANTQYVRMWVCDQSNAQTKEKGGRKYIRQRWDATAATDAACGAFPGNISTGLFAGTGADRTAMCKWVRFRVNKFSGKTLKFKALRVGGRSTPAFVLGSDNANPYQLFSAMSYMASKNMPAYLSQYVAGLSGAAALSGYRRASAAGVEITGDDIVDRPLGSTVLDQPTMQAAVDGTISGLVALGLPAPKVWVANNNSTSYLMIRELQRAGFVCNRNGSTDGRYLFPEGGVPDSFRLPAASFDNLNWTAIQPILDRAIQYGCTLWIYWHGVLSSARLDADRTANVTGTAGAPIARSASETLTAYRARALALGTSAGTASVTYFDNTIGSAALGIWWEELQPMIDYLNTRSRDGTCVVVSPREWCADVGLLSPAA